MSLVDLVMPKMGESIMEATILKWHKQPGDAVKQDETVLEIATDKVDTEVPSITEGIVEEVLYKVNDVVPIGSVIARIRTSNGTAASAPVQAALTTTPNPVAIPLPPVSQHHHPAPAAVAANPGGPRFYSPLVLNIAANEGVPLSELESIPGTGNEGRVTKKRSEEHTSEL